MSYAQNGIDLKFIKYFNFRNGIFIEAGANDGVLQSNTCLLERDYGWTGLLVEPNPFKYKECISNRPNSIVENYALVNDDYKESFIEGDFSHTDSCNSLMSMVMDKGDFFDDEMLFYKNLKKKEHGVISVPVTTLTFLLEKHSIDHIDFCSLDVEGYEISALNGLDFNKFSPTYFLIETTTFENRRKSIFDYMKIKNYDIIEQISDNDFLFKKI